jgi:hypothetical protein
LIDGSVVVVTVEDPDRERDLVPKPSLPRGTQDRTVRLDLVERGAMLRRQDPFRDLPEVLVDFLTELTAGQRRVETRGVDSAQDKLVAHGLLAAMRESDRLPEHVETDSPFPEDLAETRRSVVHHTLPSDPRIHALIARRSFSVV